MITPNSLLERQSANTSAPAGSRTQRRAARRAAQAHRRQDWVSRGFTVAKFGGPILLALLLVVGIFQVVANRSGGNPSSDAAARTQTTLLLQIVGPDRRAMGDVLLGSQTDGSSGTGLVIPSHLLSDVPGLGSMPFGETARIKDLSSTRDTVSDQLGVFVDGVWRVGPNGLARIIDSVGGVTIDLDADVYNAAGETVFAKGPGQQLNGASVVALLSAASAKESDQLRDARFSAVVAALLAALPENVEEVAATVRSLGSSGASNWTPEKVSDLFVQLGRTARSDNLTLSLLPVKPIDTGGDTSAFRIDAPSVKQVVSASFLGAKLPQRKGGPLRVLVQNGAGTPGLVQAARAELVAKQLTFVNGQNATAFGHANSMVIIEDATPQSRDAGAEVAAALNLPASSIRIAVAGQSVADVIVILGKDFDGNAAAGS